MSSEQDSIGEAKRLLPLPRLMESEGHAQHCHKSARCPFHDDSRNSFSVWQRADGGWAWKCHAGCGGGDEIDYLSKHSGLSNLEACRELMRRAGLRHERHPAGPQHTAPQFDWAACLSALTQERRAKIAEWRGYSPKWIDWLHNQKLIGWFEGHAVAFPVQERGGSVVGCHYRIQHDGSWRFFPPGTRTEPLIIGDLSLAEVVFAFESQWDMLACLDVLHHHIQPLEKTAAIATRGAANSRLLAKRCRPEAVLYAFGQNDDAGLKWVAGVAANCDCTVRAVTIPAPFKDLNAWTQAGAIAADVSKAISEAQTVSKPPKPETGPTLQDVSKPATRLLPKDLVETADTPEPFPIEALPPDLALITNAVSTALRVPYSLPGLMVLAIVSASIGKGLVLDWRFGRSTTPANLFVLLSAESGTGKSEGYKMVAEPFLALERGIQEHWRKNVQPKLQADLRYAEVQLKKLDRKLGKESTTSEEAEQCRAQMQFHLATIEELKVQLHEPQLSVQDATVEKVATVMHWNDEIICSFSSDARKLADNLLGRYSANKNLADDGIYLNAFSGDDVKVDRQNREGVRLANPCLTLLWAFQPDALDMLLGEQSLQQGGFLARCLLAHTQAELQHMDGELRAIPGETRHRWAALIRNLVVTYRQPRTLPAGEPEVKNEVLQ